MIPFLGGAYQGRSTVVSPQTCVNLFYERGKTGESLVGTPGAILFNGDKSAEVRGGIEFNGLSYFVIGNEFLEFSAGGTPTLRGTLGTSTGRVSLAHNGTRAGSTQQIMIVDGTTTRYIYSKPDQTLTGYVWVRSSVVVFFDGYFVFNEVGTDRFWNTAAYDGTTVGALDFQVAEGSPDIIVDIVAEQRQLLVIGAQSLDVYYNAGGADDLFQRFQGGFTQTGCAATHTAQRFDNSVVWLSRNERGDGQVMRLTEGFQPSVISTQEVNYQISTYQTISDAFAYVYQEEGHEFYCLTFPAANKTWAYDALTQEWHQRAHSEDGRERYNCHIFAGEKHLLGDFQNGNIYQLDPSVGTFNGARIYRERTSDEWTDEQKRIRLSSVQLDMETGTANPNLSRDDAFWLSYSKDGGRTFSNEIEASMGFDFRARVIWRKLGKSRNWIFKIRTWTPNRVIIKGLIERQYGEAHDS